MAERTQAQPAGSPASGLGRRVRRALLFGAVLAPAVVAACDDDTCENGTCVDESGMRLLDRVCDVDLLAGPSCGLEGVAEQVSGVTADSIGFRLGDAAQAGAPGQQGSLLIRMQALADVTYLASSGTFSVEVLAVAREPGTTPRLTSRLTWGACGQTCPGDPSPYAVEIYDEYTWITVVSGATAPTALPLPDDAMLTLSGAGIDIADIRAISVYPEGCSIAGPVGSRR